MGAFAFAISAALIVKTSDGWKLMAYILHLLSGAKLNWSVYNKELFAIIKAFEYWRHWILPARHEIKIWWDHQNLSYLCNSQQLMAQEAQWYMALQQYNFKTIHKAKIQNGCIDALSRREEFNIDPEISDSIQISRRISVLEEKRVKVLALCHDPSGAGHFGNKKIYK